jgi:N-methylhydantoinase A/oxoprolinase/acetone carboxylase beta subunit
MRGAAFLSGIEDCAVVDVGGTTSDVGILERGFPREASVAASVGGLHTNFRIPDISSIGIGGGSLVRREPQIAVGPESVGYEITRRALVFGGETLTATDLAVAGRLVEIGDPSLVAGLDRSIVDEGLAFIEHALGETIDRMKTRVDPLPIVVVGGGSILIGEGLPGASRLIKPDHYPVANAIGAAIAEVGGEVDRVFSLDRIRREEAIAQAKDEAKTKALDAGATSGSIRIVDIEEVPLSYLSSDATRIRVKAVGELALTQGRNMTLDRRNGD